MLSSLPHVKTVSLCDNFSLPNDFHAKNKTIIVVGTS